MLICIAFVIIILIDIRIMIIPAAINYFIILFPIIYKFFVFGNLYYTSHWSRWLIGSRFFYG
jgi:hypothetical protein